ncbi:hypothetical protein GCM10027408_22550 [Microbacterium tumbae]
MTESLYRELIDAEAVAVIGFYDAFGYERFDVSTAGKRLIADA